MDRASTRQIPKRSGSLLLLSTLIRGLDKPCNKLLQDKNKSNGKLVVVGHSSLREKISLEMLEMTLMREEGRWFLILTESNPEATQGSQLSVRLFIFQVSLVSRPNHLVFVSFSF